MKKRFTPAQITFALRQAALGTPVSEITPKMNVTDVTLYRWKKLYANLGVAEIRRLKQMEEENHQLKRPVADLTLDKQMLQDMLSRKSEAGSTKGTSPGDAPLSTTQASGGP